MADITNSNTRVFYATQAVTIGGRGNMAAPQDSWKTGNCDQTGAATIVHGLQSVGIDTNFNLEQAFELGQLSIYENIVFGLRIHSERRALGKSQLDEAVETAEGGEGGRRGGGAAEEKGGEQEDGHASKKFGCSCEAHDGVLV